MASSRLLLRLVHRQRPHEFVCRHGGAEEMALQMVTSQGSKMFRLLEGFHTFGNHPQSKAVTHRDDGGNERCVVAIAWQLRYERSINF